MAIVALPEDPEDKTERRLQVVGAIALAIVVLLFLYSMLDAYVL